MIRAKKNKRKSHFSSKLILGLLLIALGIGITISASSFAANGFKARNVEEYIEKLMAENKDLELQVTNLKSLQALESAVAKDSGLVPITDMRYLKLSKQPPENSVSKK